MRAAFSNFSNIHDLPRLERRLVYAELSGSHRKLPALKGRERKIGPLDISERVSS